jgi:succinyl-CoA synthetase alpha subunit
VSILIGRDTRLVVQGITGREGEFHSRAMLEYGTLVAGRPRQGGRWPSTAGPVFDTVIDAVREAGANTSCIFVPAAGAPDAVLEAVDAGIGTIFCITEGIPALDMISAAEQVKRAGARLIGPNCPGATSPGRAKVGIIPGSVHREGRVGVVSRSGTLTYEAVQAMTDAGLGQSTCVGIGGDPIIGTTFLDVLQLFAAYDETDAIVLIGEIGGAAEETAAAWAAEHLKDIPKVAFIAGRTAPEGKRMGHAGAIISGGAGTAASKVDALEAAGFRVAGHRRSQAARFLEAGRADRSRDDGWSTGLIAPVSSGGRTPRARRGATRKEDRRSGAYGQSDGPRRGRCP